MANELRVRTNFVGGLVEDNPLLIAGTTLTSAGLAVAPAITSTSHFPIIIDPDGLGGAPEIAYVTLHTAAATTGTILRGQEGTTAREHLRDVPWIHGPTQADYDRTYITKPAVATSRSSSTLGALSTPQQVVAKGVLTGQIVELLFAVSGRSTGDNLPVAGIARITGGVVILQRATFYVASAGTRSEYVTLFVVDDAPGIGDITYELYVATPGGAQLNIDDGVSVVSSAMSSFAEPGRTQLRATTKWLAGS